MENGTNENRQLLCFLQTESGNGRLQFLLQTEAENRILFSLASK
jgi:hypothetical protein